MTYRAKGRHIVELIFAIAFVTFLVGFITVLCIGNYFRAKRAQERQKQKREAKRNSNSHHQQQYSSAGSGMGSYEAPIHKPSDTKGIQA